jgi:hypothetical protein
MVRDLVMLDFITLTEFVAGWAAFNAGQGWQQIALTCRLGTAAHNLSTQCRELNLKLNTILICDELV